MKVVFWGVRGSTPSPITAEQVQAKINAVVQRIQPKDLVNMDSRQRFLASLPKSLYGTAGGNTPCVQLTTKNGSQFILDAGTGLRVLGKRAEKPKDGHYSIFLSHLHWDHIQGFPFFTPFFEKTNSFDIYSCVPDTEKFFNDQLAEPFLPPSLKKSLCPNIKFHQIVPGTEFEVDGIKINCCRMNHPGFSYSYSFCEGKKKFVYATDVELYSDGFVKDESVRNVFKDADVVLLDSQYTPQEAVDKIKWGHSPFCYAVDFAAEMGIKTVYIFHHEPDHDDKKLDSILQTARWYAKFISAVSVNVNLAFEGGEVEL